MCKEEGEQIAVIPRFGRWALCHLTGPVKNCIFLAIGASHAEVWGGAKDHLQSDQYMLLDTCIYMPLTSKAMCLGAAANFTSFAENSSGA